MQDNVMDVVQTIMAQNGAERLAPCGIKAIVIGTDVIPSVTQHVQELLAERGATTDRARVLVIVDRTPIMRLGAAVKPQVEQLLAEHFEVTTLVLDDGHPELHASEEVVEQAAAAAVGFDAVVTLGGGTITDIGKMSSARVGNPPLVALQTAASVDGYTDDVSVLLKNGVKRTVPSRWPDVVIADTALIAEAPVRMNRAGYGEINSMFVAPADWLLAKELGFDDSFSRGPVALLEEVGSDIDNWSPGLAEAEFDSVAQLVRALAIRGVATGVAGSTALLSGVEHVVSHMLDIARGARHQSVGLHGAQVGVASVIAAIIWEDLIDHLDVAHLLGELPPPLDLTECEREVLQAFADLDETGALARECWRDYQQKCRNWQENREAVVALVRAWPQHREAFRSLVKSPAEIARGLQRAGSPLRFEDLDPVIEAPLGFWAVRNCGLMRNRLTAIDFLTFFGWWDDTVAASVIARASAFAASGVGGRA